MRRLFLWLAGNAWLRERFPRLPFAQRAVRRFMPGEHIDDALAAATDFQHQGIRVLLTRLGENLTRIEEADEVAAEYQRLIDQSAARGLDAEVSVKLTQLGFDLDAERTFEHVVGARDPCRPPTARRSGWTWSRAPTRSARSRSTSA